MPHDNSSRGKKPFIFLSLPGELEPRINPWLSVGIKSGNWLSAKTWNLDGVPSVTDDAVLTSEQKPTLRELFAEALETNGNSGDDYLELEIELPEDVTDDVAAAFVRHLADRVDDLHRARGGSGLTVETINVYDDDSGRERKKVAS